MTQPQLAPYREIFLIVSGSAMRLLDGTSYELTPGSIFIADDLGSTGRGGGGAGPCVYVAIQAPSRASAHAVMLL